MIDPLDIVRAVSTLTAATVVGCGVLNWYTRDAHATKGGAIWRTRAATLIFAATGIGVVANILGAIGTLLHGGFARRVLTSRRLRSCYSSEYRTPELVHPVEGLNGNCNFSRTTGIVA